ncbi:transcriptional regulator LdtR [Candidatus Liberibacter americanus]|uniref:Transcriptional regulator n=1 Tax=Candidatus Liberibacter americanus str. Sao Paulo TaxID=1261131 RepID=U6B7K3_9HYPH|nr:winged helix DNA-binding protein [Candidatus Liberibacter americanus]AHA27697.1 Transcriptional regulator [Candidatus Liberibacter americanus str. Sao Paulo]EMS36404.1 MarR family transcriptional regulator [Candidatus Liberibacter americanus PW_SP]
MSTNIRSKVVLDTKDKVDDISFLYIECLRLVERLHRSLLCVTRDEFERKGRNDINSVQALLLFNIGDSELTAGELRSRGYYLGSNVSYNLKKLIELGFIKHQKSRVDKRSIRISLTPSGKEIAKTIFDLYKRHVESISQVGGLSADDFIFINKTLQRLDRFWGDQIAYRL